MNLYIFNRIVTEDLRLLYATEDADGVIGETDKKYLAMEKSFASTEEADAWMKQADAQGRHWMAAERVNEQAAKEHHAKTQKARDEKLSWQLEWERRHEQ